ncbi:dihydrofolate synthase [Sanguibacteroides justesenii]|uniref:bifunctional folylpolyglutamate synthase/dihydrofolate synthase n=1 Tax=Sanguibacteroides justesenii TaxID=1547597 RepID=UPI000D91D1DF|nr:folylpolyglutamate synthase/dihydrofolate synthase family protein [Sanguibacteroides justesenii]PXZ43866.1 dihydrofolate synthase [Sanguibacteroides justesenii]
MNYKETLEWLFTQLPMYQREGKAAYKANLDNTLKLDQHFDSPHRQFKTIHVAGTNGKGSVSHMLASILQEAGYKTGLYTSPHLKDFRERIKINGEMVSEEYVVNFVKDNRDLFAEIKPSFFEMTVAMAFKYFADQQVDIAVIEVGLGGRLDSTNIIKPLASIITNISFDHMALLGDTLEKIAREKAGIIKPQVPVIIGTRDTATDFVFEDKADECQSLLEFASDNWEVNRNSTNTYTLHRRNGILFDNIQPDLKGFYQRKNIPTVLETVLTLKEQGLSLPDHAVYAGIARTIQNTGLLGRWQELKKHPYTVCDTGHNIDGLTEVVAQINACRYEKLHFVIGMVNDKDVDSVLHILPKDAAYYFCKASIPRAMNEKILAEKARSVGLTGETFPTVDAAYRAAQKAASPRDMIYIGGSTFVVAEIV